MNTKIIQPLTTFLLFMLLIVSVSRAQQTATIQKQPDPLPLQTINKPATANYTFKTYQAPNKNFGYDILLNGKIVYHEFASLLPQGNVQQTTNQMTTRSKITMTDVNRKGYSALSKKGDAEKAALLTIEKIKRREPPMLSENEFRKINAQ